MTAVVYFATAYSCHRTSTYGLGPTESDFWFLIAIALVMLGLAELMDLPAMVGDLLRSTARKDGWYGHREFYQVRLIYLAGGTITAIVLALLFGARKTSSPCELALALTGLVMGYIIVRAISLHSIDAIMGRSFFGIHFNRIPELTGIGLVWLLSAWRMIR